MIYLVSSRTKAESRWQSSLNGGDEIVVSPETLLRLFLVLLYAPAGLIAFRRVLPGLSPAAKRMAILMLAAHLLAIVAAIENYSASGYAYWLWHLDLEWNIPSALSSTQLALVGGVALAVAWRWRAVAAWHRLYLVALAIVFLFLGLEEFFSQKDAISEDAWRRNLAVLGAAVFLATAVLAARTPKSERAWLILLLGGLSLMAFGGGLLDGLPETCGDIGILRIDGCFYLYRSPEEMVETLGGWAALLAVLSRLSSADSPTPRPLWLLLCLMPALWILMLIRLSPVNDFQVAPPAQPASVKYESKAELHGFQLDERGLPAIAFMFLPYDVDIARMGFSVHLVDQLSGESHVSREIIAHRRYEVWPGGRGYEPVYAQAIDLAIPPDAPVNRALWIVFSHWREIDSQFSQQALVASDLRRLNPTQVVLGELALQAESTGSTSAPIAVFGNGFTLEAAVLPQGLQLGEAAKINFTWRAKGDGSEDYAQLLHFIHAETGEQWGFDQPPLGARLPTRLWYSGLRDSETWEVPLPMDLAPGAYRVYTGLYRTSDLERVNASEAEGSPFADGRVILGEITVEA